MRNLRLRGWVTGIGSQSEAGCRPRPRRGVLESESDSCILKGLSLVLILEGPLFLEERWQARGRLGHWQRGALSASLKTTLPPPWPPTTHPTSGRYVISFSSLNVRKTLSLLSLYSEIPKATGAWKKRPKAKSYHCLSTYCVPGTGR